MDNNSSDSSVEIARQFQHNPYLPENRSRYTQIKFLTIDKYSPGASLNLGVNSASGEFIMIVSSHCQLTSFDAQKAVSDLDKYDAIFGNQVPNYRGQRLDKRYIWSHFGDEEKVNMFSELENRYFFHNALSFSKRETLIKSPFDENLIGNEDRYWAQEIINRNNGQILYDPNFSCNHFYTAEGNTWKGIG